MTFKADQCSYNYRPNWTSLSPVTIINLQLQFGVITKIQIMPKHKTYLVHVPLPE